MTGIHKVKAKSSPLVLLTPVIRDPLCTVWYVAFLWADKIHEYNGVVFKHFILASY